MGVRWHESLKGERRKGRIKQWRLIVRNLPFSVTEDAVRSFFAPCGPVSEVRLPTKDNGRAAGFAFVQFSRFPDAVKALKELNAQPLGNRPVAIDWALPKEEYVSATIAEKCELENSSVETRVLNKLEQSDVIDMSLPTTSSVDKNSSRKRRIEQESSEPNPTKSEPPVKSRGPDQAITEGRTLFVRNVPLEVGEDELRELFTGFGSIKYALICRYTGTSHSKGTAFVQFIRKEDAEQCLQEAANSGLMIGSATLSVCRAVSREEMKKISFSKEEEKKRKPKDSRNLYLLKEMAIDWQSPEAKSMSESDRFRRERNERSNEEKLKNLNIIVSPTRLIVHNLPQSLTDQKLKLICRKVVADCKAEIKECRIMKDPKRLDRGDRPHSLGYGFVQFAEHQHALACLKALNNNPNIFSDQKRPIVEFSLENRIVLKLKQERMERAKAKRMALTSENATSNSEGGPNSEVVRRRIVKSKRKKQRRLFFTKQSDWFWGKKKQQEMINKRVVSRQAVKSMIDRARSRRVSATTKNSKMSKMSLKGSTQKSGRVSSQPKRWFEQ